VTWFNASKACSARRFAEHAAQRKCKLQPGSKRRQRLA
jgi:hypothetical protein